MPQSPAILDQDVLWDQLMAEVQEIHERAIVAQTFHTLMGQRSHLGTPVQYERLFRRTLEAKRSKHMTIAEVLNKANEGGYHIYGSDGMDTQAAYMGLLR